MVRKKIGIADVVITFILLISGIVCLLPVLNTLAMSFSNKDMAEAGKVFIWPVKFTTVPYEEIAKEPQFFRSFLNSVVRVLIGGVINVALTLLTAYPLSKTKRAFKAKYVYLWFLVFTMLFNPGIIPHFIVVQKLGLIDTIWSMVLPGALPVFSVIMLMNYYKGLPDSLEEAALMDGANPYYILYKIYIPLSKPSIAVVTLLSVVYHWNDFFMGLVYINDTVKRPLQTYIQQLTFNIDFIRLTQNPEQIARDMQMSGLTFNCAKLMVALIPIMLIYPLLQKYFVTGVVMGAVKE